MSEMVKQLLPAGLIALILHTAILSWRLNQGNNISPMTTPSKRIAVSLGVQKVAIPPKKTSPPEKIIEIPTPVQKKTEHPKKVREKTKKLEQPQKQIVQKPEILAPNKTFHPRIKKSVVTKNFDKKKAEVVPQTNNQPLESAVQPSPIEEKTETKNFSRATSPQPLPLSAQKKTPATSTKGIIEAKPLYRKNPKPKYPARARRLRWQGVVLLEVEVLLDGSAGEVTILESSGYKLLDKAGLTAVKKWRFIPGTENGIAKTMKVVIPLNFKLR